MNRLKLIFVVAICFFGCKTEKKEIVRSENNQEKVDTTPKKTEYYLKQKDLIPEGTAYNTQTETIYISSIYRQKIIGITAKGEIQDIIPNSFFGKLSPIGIEMDNSKNTLWACVAAAPIVNQSHIKNWETAILAFNMENKTLKKQYPLKKGTPNSFLNDITVATNGDVYATETANGKIYKIDKATDSLQLFLNLESSDFPNGITYYKPHDCLFVATNRGILKITLPNKLVTLLKSSDSINTKVIDGLAINDNYFIGHQSTKVSKFYFNAAISEITTSEVLDSGNEFDSSTTGEVGNNGYYHFIVNSQIRSGINRKEMTIKPLDSLETIIIRSIKL